MPETTPDEIREQLHNRRNWGRWGDDDQRGAINLITAEKRLQAARLVQSGRAVSLARDFPTHIEQSEGGVKHSVLTIPVRGGGAALDTLSFIFHGYTMTHVDAVCHVWDEGGMWNGRDPKTEIAREGVTFGGIEHWREGITTRGVLLDVPAFRGEPFVTQDKPLTADEMDAIAERQAVKIEPGDALAVYSGRERFMAAHPQTKLGMGSPAPGLDGSCLRFLRDNDISVLVWDLMDASPQPPGLPWTVHGAIFAYGIALVDNALLQPLAEACAEENRYEFMLTFAPLPIVGGTGSPVNPIALF